MEVIKTELIESNVLKIKEPTKELEAYIKENYTIRNPEYEKKLRLGLWVGNTPKTIDLYRTSENAYFLPVGASNDIKGIITNLNIDAVNWRVFSTCRAIDYKADKLLNNLYTYQQESVDKMASYNYGILKSAAGSGKTQMGLALICKLGLKALWLTHTQDLLQQSYSRATQYIDKKLLGKITGGKVNIAAGITFATVQTLAKQDLTLYRNEWDVVVVDECHRVSGTPAAATQFSKVLNNLAARRKYGLSATVHRADGLIKCTYALLGPVVHEVPESATHDKVMAVKIQEVNTGMNRAPADALDTDGTIIYSKLITKLAENEERNKVIFNGLMQHAADYNLILSDRLEQLHNIYNLLPEELQAKAAIIDGKTKKADREQAIEDVRQGKKHFLFASYKLAKEGLDIPHLNVLHLATPQKDYAIIVQSVGRVARKAEGKTWALCMDYVDGIGLFKNMFSKRKAIYKKNNCFF